MGVDESICSAAGVLLVNNLSNYTQDGDPASAVSILHLGRFGILPWKLSSVLRNTFCWGEEGKAPSKCLNDSRESSP